MNTLFVVLLTVINMGLVYECWRHIKLIRHLEKSGRETLNSELKFSLARLKNEFENLKNRVKTKE